MPDFHEVQLDMGIDYGAVGGPVFQTDITKTHGGWEKRNIQWSQDLGDWQLGERVISLSDLEYLDGFFRARFGQAYGFRAKIWSDYKLTRQGIGVGDGMQTDFQIAKIYPDTVAAYTKIIKKIVNGMFTLWLAGVETAAGFTLDYNTGIITFDAPPANGDTIEVECEFDTPVRFGVDKFTSTFQAYDPDTGIAHFYISSLPIEEIRV